MKIESSQTTVAFVDLVGYSAMARILENIAGPPAIATFNSAIQRTLDAALLASSLVRSECVVMTTGDGAILTFDEPRKAIKFAFALTEASSTHNAKVDDPNVHHHFRTGVATGEVAIDTDATQGNGLGGMAIVRAARLEGKAPPDGVLIDLETWQGLVEDQRNKFVGPELVQGKRGEAFSAFRFGNYPEVVATNLPPAVRKSGNQKRMALNFLDRIATAAQIDRLVITMEIPLNQVPSPRLTLEERGLEIFNWAEAYGKMDELEGELFQLFG